ncbi:MAG: hypothetical protein LBG06_11320, partial [Deltaproteobacteria bacterium]|nr:hypothetical protein [Deltaproteobacteria bacterium]
MPSFRRRRGAPVPVPALILTPVLAILLTASCGGDDGAGLPAPAAGSPPASGSAATEGAGDADGRGGAPPSGEAGPAASAENSATP